MISSRGSSLRARDRRAPMLAASSPRTYRPVAPAAARETGREVCASSPHCAEFTKGFLTYAVKVAASAKRRANSPRSRAATLLDRIQHLEATAKLQSHAVMAAAAGAAGHRPPVGKASETESVGAARLRTGGRLGVSSCPGPAAQQLQMQPRNRPDFFIHS